MLSTVIENIKTLFSKYVLLSSFYPILIFTFVNFYFLFRTSPRFRHWVSTREPHLDLTTMIVQSSVIIVAVALAAFFLSTISYFLREVLEGKHWPSTLSKLAIPLQRERLERLDNEINDLSLSRFTLKKQFKAMRERLTSAREKGTADKNGQCDYDKSAGAIEELRTLRAHGEIIGAHQMENAVKAIEAALGLNDADATGSAAEKAALLDRDNVDLDGLLSYANARIDQALVDLYGRRQLSFGDAPLLPTSAGNMVQAVATYTLSRYEFSIDLLWSRLQSVMSKDSFVTLQDAKAQLDSLIALWWLATVTTLVWWPVSAYTGALGVFIAIAIGGPALCVLLYFLVLASYRGFHDLLRSAVDLNRFELIKALHLPLPAGPIEEKNLWKSLGALAQYGDELSATYRHP